MLVESPHFKKEDNIFDVNKYFLENLTGELDDKEAQVTLVEFLRNNPRMSIDLLTGGDLRLYAFQEMLIKAWSQRNYSCNVLGRGCSKSFTVAAFCIYYIVFNPGAKILIASSNFRTSRRILEQIDIFVNSKNAYMLRQCFPKKLSKNNDRWFWEINDGFITALPLTEGTRGQRCDVLICDEFLLLPQEIVEKVLFPFLTASTDQNYKMKVRAIENRLIKEGKMLESERMKFDSQKKMINLSSASYEFEYLYKMYKGYMSKILNDPNAHTVLEDIDNADSDENIVKNATYFIAQMSYDAVPEDLIDKTIIEEAKSGGASNAVFLREYCARFIDDSDNYFSAKAMRSCTIPRGESPHIELVGDKNSEYIISIDPNASKSDHGDHFAMSVMKILNRQSFAGCIVHQYADCAKDIKDYILYFLFLLKNFNTVFIVIDGNDSQFIDTCNNSHIFKEEGLELSFVDGDFLANNKEEELKTIKRSYNLTNKRICLKQNFVNSSVKIMNEYLQASLDHKRILFASPLLAHSDFVDSKLLKLSVVEQNREIHGTYEEAMLDFIDWQDTWMDMAKKQASSVIVTTTALGAITFDIPNFAKKSRRKDRLRKDSYTTMMLANWGLKCYLEMENFSTDVEVESFTPFFM